jgi:hypothetical protein
MSQYELTESFASSFPKPGEPSRNPLGRPVGKFSRWREIKAELRAIGEESCGKPGFEHLTKWQYTLREVFELAMAGDRWAVKYITDRLYGRVPLTVEMDVDVTQREPDLSDLSEAELLARVEIVRAMLTAPKADAPTDMTDAVLIDDPHPDTGDTERRGD